MLLLNSLRKIVGRTAAYPRGPRRRPGRSRVARWLLLEPLEDRTLPSCTLSLVPSEPAPQLVGERILWTATATDCGKDLVYQFGVSPAAGPFRVARDFSPSDSFAWAPLQEGAYNIRVIVKDGYQATDTVSAVASDVVNSRVTGRDAVLTPTSNPLVALYSAPPCSEGAIHVEFAEAGHRRDWRSTNTLPCEPELSRNFLVAGLLPETTYQVRHVVTDHHHHRRSTPLLFTTGALPPTLTFPTFTVRQPPGPGSDRDQDMVFHSLVGLALRGNRPIATDLSGRVEWYYDTQQSGLGITNMNTVTLLPGGTVIGMGDDRFSVRNNSNVLREIDLAGNPIRETNLAAVNAQLTALGHDVTYGFHHDAQRLPDGSLVVLAYPERTVTINGVPTDYIGEMVLVLDQDFQVRWVWDAFDHLDVNRGPVLGEGAEGPTTVVPRLPAVDWLHVNAVALSPADGNLILSVRHQDWVIKIDYRNGAGDGHVVWRLGEGGNFTVNAADPNPWFSHQHNAHYIDDHTLILFDNGNTRRESDPDAQSRGQVWRLDEHTMTATLVFNGDLGNYSAALGAAQRLSNGNFFFTSGYQGEPPNRFGQEIEVRPDGTQVYVLESDRVNRIVYRSYRTRTLYEGTDDSLNAGGGRGPSAGSSHRRSVPSSASDPAAVLLGPTAAALAAPARQPATPATPPAATPIPASAVPLVPIDGTGADPTSPDVPALRAAVSGALFGDLENDLGHDWLGDDLAWALIA